MEKLIYLVSVMVIILIVLSILKSLFKKTIKTIFFIVTMIYLSINLKIPSSIAIVLFCWISYIIKDLYIDLKQIISCFLRSYKRYKNKWLEKIVTLLFEVNCFIFKLLIYIMYIYIVFEKKEFIYTIEISCILLSIILIFKYIKKIINRLLIKKS